MTQQVTHPTHPAPGADPAAPPHVPPGPGGGPGHDPRPAPRRRAAAVAGAVAAAVLLLGGLAVGALLLLGTTVLDTAEAEREIARVTEEQAGVAPTDVSCPEDVGAQAGATFSCTAALEDQPMSFTVTQTDDEGGVRIDSDESFVDVGVVEDSLTEQLGAVAGVPVVSTCDTGGRSVLVGGVGEPIRCTVTNAGDAADSIEVVATVDDAGAVSYEVL